MGKKLWKSSPEAILAMKMKFCYSVKKVRSRKVRLAQNLLIPTLITGGSLRLSLAQRYINLSEMREE